MLMHRIGLVCVIIMEREWQKIKQKPSNGI